MGSEILLFGYSIVCLSMILFNLVQSLVLRRNDKRLDDRSRGLESFLADQFAKIELGKSPEAAHFLILEKKLGQLHYLLAFDRMLERADITIRNTEFSEYLDLFQPVLVRLAKVYTRREAIETAYFAHFLTKHRMIMDSNNEAIQNIMVECVHKDSLYCRVNGLRGLCAFGSVEKVVEAVTIIDQNVSFFHGKLLTELLLSFTGDHNQLIMRFWVVMEGFNISTQVSLMNYIRFKTGAFCERFLEIMNNYEQNKELRLAAIRYFGRYICEDAKASLLAFLADSNPDNWELAAISASSLSRYEGADVTEALIKAMSSEQWYVRFNAASSLKSLKLDYDELIEVVHKGDRYAREMVMYRLISREREDTSKGETL